MNSSIKDSCNDSFPVSILKQGDLLSGTAAEVGVEDVIWNLTVAMDTHFD